MKNIRRLILRLLIIPFGAYLTLTVLCSASLSEVGKQDQPSPTKHTWNLKDVDIRSIIDRIAVETRRDFILAPEVKGKITFISGYPLTSEELYQAFLAILTVNGFEAISDGAIVKIVPAIRAKEGETSVLENNQISSSNEMAVTIVRVKYISSVELVSALKQLVYQYGYIEAYPPTNDIIIADISDNISKLITLIRNLDQPAASRIGTIHLKYTHSAELVKILDKFLRQKNNSLKNIILAADERSNNLLIYGGTPEQQAQVQSLISELDTPQSRISNRTEVISLKYLRAERMAVIVNSLIENYTHEKKGDACKSSLSSVPMSAENQASSFMSGSLTDFSNQSLSSGNAIQTSGSYMTEGSRTAVDFTNMARKIPRSGSISPNVQWEESTNSIILTAPPDLLNQLKQVILKMDVRRPQVLIEAIIAEVDINLAKELGVELNTGGKVQILTRFSSTLPVSGIGSNNNIAISNPPVPDAPGQGLTGAFFSGSNLRILLRALEEDTRTNILSTPNIVTLDNEPAQIKVGQRISFSIGQIQNNPTGGNPFNYFNQQDIGLILTINPQITSDGSIKLIIEQELSSVLPGQVSAGNNPNLNERFIHTTVMANDGDLLVLGGLIQDEWQDVVSKVPLLGDLPVIGKLFRSHEKQLNRQNLMVFLKPTILDSKKHIEDVVVPRYNAVRKSQMETQSEDMGSASLIHPPHLSESKTNPSKLPIPFD